MQEKRGASRRRTQRRTKVADARKKEDAALPFNGGGRQVPSPDVGKREQTRVGHRRKGLELRTGDRGHSRSTKMQSERRQKEPHPQVGRDQVSWQGQVTRAWSAQMPRKCGGLWTGGGL